MANRRPGTIEEEILSAESKPDVEIEQPEVVQAQGKPSKRKKANSLPSKLFFFEKGNQKKAITVLVSEHEDMWTIRLVAIRLLAILKFLQQVSRLKTKAEKIDNCCKYPTNNQKEFTLGFIILS